MSIADAAKSVYERHFRTRMEREFHGQFIAIEPSSHQYFLGETFMDAALKAKQALPTKMCFVIRIGFGPAVHIGAASS